MGAIAALHWSKRRIKVAQLDRSGHVKTILLNLGVCGAVVLLPGCATVESPPVRDVPRTTPSVSPALQEQRAKSATLGGFRTLKRKVAIGRFSNETQYGRSFLVDKDYNPIGKQAVDILSKKLLETEKFILLERADLEKINAELGMAESGKLRNMADYLVVGSITEFGRKTEGKVGVFSRTKRQTAHARVTVRLVDVYTGEVLYAEEGSGEAFSEVGTVLGIGSQADYDSSLNDKVLSAAIGNLSSKIIENLLGKPWRSYILGFADGQFILAGGPSQGLKAGDTFEVVAQGKTVKNPQTNMEIALPGKTVGKVRIVSFSGNTPGSEVALAELVSGELPKSDDASAYRSYYVQETATPNR
jgi:curli biogenesis system outer membrane secretion channel CsgG